MSLTNKKDEGQCDCVRYKIEIYNYERKIETILDRIKDSHADPKDKSAILNFYRDCLSRGLSKARIFKYLYTINNIINLLGKSLEKATKDDIAELVRKIEGKNYSEWTKHDYKVILRVFFRWLRRTEDYPEEGMTFLARSSLTE